MSDDELREIEADFRRFEDMVRRCSDGTVSFLPGEVYVQASRQYLAATPRLLSLIATLRAERDAAVAEAVAKERERAAGVALRLAKTRFSFSDQPWVCSEIAVAIRRGE